MGLARALPQSGYHAPPGQTAGALLRLPRRLLAERRAVAMVELALIGPFVLLALVALFEFAYLFLALQLVQNAAQTAARSIQTGNAQSQSVASGTTTASQAFTNNVLCKALLLLPCSNLLVNAQAVPTNGNYLTLSAFSVPVQNGQVNGSGLAFCNGAPGQLMQLNVVFMAPVILGFLWPNAISYNGANSIPLYAAAAFADEKFSVAGTEAGAC